MEITGIEPASSVCKTDILTKINYIPYIENEPDRT